MALKVLQKCWQSQKPVSIAMLVTSIIVNLRSFFDFSIRKHVRCFIIVVPVILLNITFSDLEFKQNFPAKVSRPMPSK